MEVDSSVSSRSTNAADNFTYSQERMVTEIARLIYTELLDFRIGEKPAFMIFAMRATGPYSFAYTRDLMVKDITRLIFTEGLQLSFGERFPFVQFVKKALNPNYTEVKIKEVVNEGKKEYMNFRKELRSVFSSLSHRVSLACDVWRNEDGNNHIRITSHWMDGDWLMQRRIINFKELYSPLRADEIFDAVKKSLEVWGVREKTFSLTVDDVTDCADAVEDLKSFTHPILDGKLFRVRCVCRVLSSCILDGLDHVRAHISKIRRFNTFPHDHKESYTYLCEKYGLKPKFTFPTSDVFGWDDTREILKRWMQHKDVLNEHIATTCPDDQMSEQDWEVVSVYIRFLDVFYEAVDFVSRNYYPSSSGVLLHLVNIAKLFSEYRGSLMFEEKISVMEEKFLEHFSRIPDLFCLAAIMDPRIKLSGCECLIESYYECMNRTEVNVEQEKRKVSNLLNEMFNLYALQFNRPEQSFSSEGFAWSLLSKKKRKTEDLVFDELAFYLQAPFVLEKETGDFDILGWWKKHEGTYPVLGAMARDLLSTAVSTLAPEFAFMIIDEKRIMDKSYHYRWGLLELYTCLKDWFNAELRTQGVRDPEPDDDDDVDVDDDDGGDDDDGDEGRAE